jgi:excisionase family DNA binding protein
MASEKRDLLGAAQVSEYPGLGAVTIYRWCREGRLSCLKIGKSWRIRCEARGVGEPSRPRRALGHVRRAVAVVPAVPDSVIALAETTELLHQLDAAFLQVAEARGGLLWSSFTAASRRSQGTSYGAAPEPG